MTAPSASDPLTVLGLAPGAGAEEIAAAYRKLVRRYPPELAPERFAAIHDAYLTLTSPARRMAAAPTAPERELARLFPLPALALGPDPPPPPPIADRDLEPLLAPVRRAVLARLLAAAFGD